MPVTGIVKPQKGPPLRPRPVLKVKRLGAFHVRLEPAQKDDARPLPVGFVIGDAPALIGIEIL